MVSGTISSIILLGAGAFSLVEIVKQTFDPNSFLQTITDSIGSIVNFFISIRDFMSSMLNIFPTPFSTLINTFLIIMFSLFLWKLVKGGG